MVGPWARGKGVVEKGDPAWKGSGRKLPRGRVCAQNMALGCSLHLRRRKRHVAQWVGLGALTLPWAVLFRLTYWELSWDVVVSCEGFGATAGTIVVWTGASSRGCGEQGRGVATDRPVQQSGVDCPGTPGIVVARARRMVAAH